MGGMGKTALAREAAHWWLRKGAIGHAVFHSFERLAGAERVVQVLGQALMGDRFSALSGEEQWRRAVELFHQQPVLLVWDNFESTLPRFAEQPGSAALQGGNGIDAVQRAALESGAPSDDPITGFSAEARELLQQLYRELTAPTDGHTPKGKLLITCRPADAGLPLPEKAKIALEGLHPLDALYLLRAVMKQKAIDPERPGCERFEMDDLLKMLAWQPLAMELVTPHLNELTPKQIRAEFAQLLERFVDEDHPEARNRSLLASLDFSVQRLSPAARAVLPMLAWFQGGVFERFLLDFIELERVNWFWIREELMDTALIRLEKLPGFAIPYLNLHPTLAFLSSPEARETSALGERFLVVYLDVMGIIDNMLQGPYPTEGMALAVREEANLRRALWLAFQAGEHHKGWQIADTLRNYLERVGRWRERDTLVAWVRECLQKTDDAEGIDEANCAAIRDHAWSLFEQGREEEGLMQVQRLLDRLQQCGGDPIQVALTQARLGRIHDHAGRSELALAPLRAAIASLDRSGKSQQTNLSVALGSLANACLELGRFDEALAAAQRALAINRELNRTRNVAVGFEQIGAILMAANRYAEAEEHYHEALVAVRQAGDIELEASLLQHFGVLYDDQGHHDRAAQYYREAFLQFQTIGNQMGEMQTSDLIASAEQLQGRLDEAESWYKRSRELAEQRQDRWQLATIVGNLSSLYLTHAEQESDPAAQTQWLEKALVSVRESLEIKLTMQDQLGAAASYSNLGLVYFMSENLKAAEENLRQALMIREPLNHPRLLQIYDGLMEIARARGDEQAAAQWQAKRDAKQAELERPRTGN
uniref:Tetratricopeptide repeat-containing protein n=1 Tax=Candidatus Kentrum eta TaxID=2126337 RepID=A0A450USG3_9GAMM|nr:MAG: Tetratricopeptide repeat-containing protein [Candidatus Kentron sp. H]VFJ88269.1 MAG: Tetratricopeptide repeat-containing protein [Candidatus Kentron sp. H]VFJ95491.1 MAG: Tetratricopeptide repeat-containing protein [Candidatus Kentron sp. H]